MNDSLINKLINCGVDQNNDSAELIVKKQTLSLVAIIIGVVAGIWGFVYFLLGHYLSSSIPSSYSIISALTLYYIYKTKKYTFLQNSQLIMVLVLPFLLMWSLGGFNAGSYMMIWAIFTPIASLSIQKKGSIIWFVLFVILVIISGFIDQFLIENVTPLSDTYIVSPEKPTFYTNNNFK